jgi:hypothetical protein
VTANSFFRRYRTALTGNHLHQPGHPAVRDGYSFGRRYLAALFRVSLRPRLRDDAIVNGSVSDKIGEESPYRFDRILGPAIAVTAAVFTVKFEWIFNFRYDATIIVGALIVSVGAKAKSPAVASVGAVVIALLLIGHR